jgi:predicted aldo/keto reductase-like oxidoreductase
MPCPCGVDIPAIFGTWNEAFKYNTNISGNGRYRRMVEENKGADQCVECGACMEMCPQQLNIPELLKAASAELS